MAPNGAGERPHGTESFTAAGSSNEHHEEYGLAGQQDRHAAQATSVDDLISSASKGAEAAATGNDAPAEAAPEKKSKKDKDKSMRLVYSDNDTSPEEKMAKMPRYAFTPEKKEETVLGTVGAAVTGVVTGPDDVIDKQG